jgi:hypothetical protein
MQVKSVIVDKPIQIYSEKDQFILLKDNLSLSLSKKNGNANPVKEYAPISSPILCYGIVGCIDAKTQKYLIYIDEVENKGKYLEANVYRIKQFKYIPYNSDHIAQEDSDYLLMINDFLDRNPLFYSDKIDLTMSFQYMKKRSETSNSPDSMIFKFTNNIYCWNSYLAQEYNRLFNGEQENDNEGMQHFVYPIINGFFGTCDGNEYSPNMQLVLIARKDIRRSGMRFLIRGADNHGHVANCVEVEELLIYKEEGNILVNSYVQMRGSIPLLWTQEPSVKLNPKIRVNNNFPDNYNAFCSHINELIDRYDSVHCINLIDKKKDQLIIGKEYEKLVLEYKSKEPKFGKNLDFSWFDFHSECKKMQYNNIKKLFLQENVTKSLEESKYNIIKIDNKEYNNLITNEKELKYEEIFYDKDLLNFVQKQKVVFRTNCIDSLDRTNVVQSVFGRYFLLLILKDLKLSDVSPSKDNISISFKEGFENKFKNIWADNGDHISLAYSGTGAMKSDFVRTGKRTALGALDDGILTTKRLFINNFRDGYNQDCHDYFLGTLNPKKEVFKKHSLAPIYTVFIIAALIGFNLMRMITPQGFSLAKLFLKLPLLLIFTCLIAFLIIYPGKKQFIDLHTRHS